MKILPFLFPLIAFAGEDISTPQDHSGHRIEQQNTYAIGSIGAGRYNDESSVAVGAGIGLKLAGREWGSIFGELTLNHFGTYHTGEQQCATVAVNATQSREYPERPEKPSLAPQIICANTESSQDYQGALALIKVNLDMDRPVEPFGVMGAAVGDLNGIVWGLGLQWNKSRVRYLDGDDVYMVDFSYEIW